MAGSGVYTSYNSSKEWHQTKGDYNDNVIVPKSILIDTADAIRLKRDGNTSIETDTRPSDNTEFIHGSNGIIPENFATEIGNLTTGYNERSATQFNANKSSMSFNLTVPTGVYSTEQILYIHIIDCNAYGRVYFYDKWLADRIIAKQSNFKVIPLNYCN